MAAWALWCRSVINIAAVSRSTMPSLLASICSSVAASMAMVGLDGPADGDVFAPRRLTSLWSGTPPSLACTVRSCRSRRSRRTKVLRHLRHLNGRSLVSTPMYMSAVSTPPPSKRIANGFPPHTRQGCMTATHVIFRVCYDAHSD